VTIQEKVPRRTADEGWIVADSDPALRFTRLYDQHYAAVFGYAVTRAGYRLAEEVASETFAIAWRRRDDIPEAALPWLLVVARNVARDQFRQQVKQASLAEELRAYLSATADVADTVADREAAIRALTALSHDDREVLTLTAWHGLSAEEAAQVLGCSRSAFFMRLHRARRRFEKAMADPAHRQETRR
jgi:RNA polymerase sigma-70 factor, ECF subfamily